MLDEQQQAALSLGLVCEDRGKSAVESRLTAWEKYRCGAEGRQKESAPSAAANRHGIGVTLQWLKSLMCWQAGGPKHSQVANTVRTKVHEQGLAAAGAAVAPPGVTQIVALLKGAHVLAVKVVDALGEVEGLAVVGVGTGTSRRNSACEVPHSILLPLALAHRSGRRRRSQRQEDGEEAPGAHGWLGWRVQGSRAGEQEGKS